MKFDLYPWGTLKYFKSQGAEGFKPRLQAMWYVKLLRNRLECWSSSTKPAIAPKAADLPACRCSYKWGWQATYYSKISILVDYRTAHWGYITALRHKELRTSKLSCLKGKDIWKRKSSKSHVAPFCCFLESAVNL